MRRKPLIVTAIAVAALAVSLLLVLTREPLVTTKFRGVQIVWKDNEAYIVVEQHRVLNEGGLVNALLHQIGVAGPNSSGKPIALATTVHIKSGVTEVYEQTLRDAGIVGPLLMVDNAPFFFVGGKSVSGFKWEGTRFKMVPPEVVSDLRRTLAPTNSEVWASSDWRKLDWENMGPIGEVYNRSFTFGQNGKLSIHLKSSREDGSPDKKGARRVSILIKSETGEILTNLEVQEMPRKVNADEFSRLQH
ncbi:MAG TPA: hypothetical protein VGN72_00010 [Tepidisphaeraceae bacterium]|jgi:hypothetical protein|nr:hypothetical protein [Tepidisphaeraceae bacterium]